MVDAYLKNLEKTYGFEGNWEPNSPVEVGRYTGFETSFLEWLKECFRIKHNITDLNQKLHSIHDIFTDSLGSLKTQKTQKGSLILSCNVNTGASVSGSNLEITATNAGGFFAVLEDMYEISVSKSELQAKMEQHDPLKRLSSVAIVVGGVYAHGMIAIFTKKGATASVSGLPDSIFNGSLPQVCNFKINAEYSKEGCIVFTSKEKKPLMPFLNIHVAQNQMRRGLYGKARVSSAVSGVMGEIISTTHGIMSFAAANNNPINTQDPHAYTLNDFSYREFLSNYGDPNDDSLLP